MRISRWSVRRPTAIHPGWWQAGVALWSVVLLLVVLALAVTANPFGLATLRADIAGGWTAFANPPWTAVLTASRGHGQAPELILQLFDGWTFRLADQRGKVVVVNFWASWCPPCRVEAPRFAAASQKYHDRGVVFVGVDINDTPEEASAFLRELGIGYPNGPDEKLTITEAYGVTGLPATFVVDRQGKLRQRWQGEIQAEQLAGFVEEALR